MTSIRARLLLALTVAVALVSLIAATATYRRVLTETSDLFDYQLRQMALSLRSQITQAPRVEVPPDQGDADFVVQIWDLFGTRVYLSRPGLPLINQIVLGYTNLSLQGEAWRAYGLQTAAGVIQIAQPLRVRERLARTAALHVAAPILLLLPIMLTCVAWIVGRGLAPLRDLTAEVQRRDAQSLAPLAATDLPAEIAPLAGELNRLLERLARALALQRAFIADAAHELRSPLTALRLQLQLLDRAPDAPARQEARERLGAAIERAIHLVEQLLTLARTDPAADRGERRTSVELADVAGEAVTDMQALAETRQVALALVTQPNCTLTGDREALRILARNLVDNAVRYTPAGGSVRVSCRTEGDATVFEVADNGPGIEPADRERVFDRFYRRAAGQEGGTGLGLAIVKAIAERHGARVALAESAGGGVRATVNFPLSLV